MIATVVPLKVKIGLRPNGHADHPDWTKLPLAQTGPGNSVENAAAHMKFLGGWKYDKTSGHVDDTPDSPVGQQFGMIFVTEQFATEAEAEFPGIITRLTEAEAIDFWDNKAHAHLDENRRDAGVIDGLVAELRLVQAVARTGNAEDQARLVALKGKIRNAIDPDHAEPGLRRNMEKRWALRQSTSGVVLKGRTP